MKSTILTIMLVLVTMTGQAQNVVNNLKIDIKVTQGIEDSGYLVHLFNRSQTQREQIGKITVTDKRASYETHVDEPLVGDLTAIFPDGSVCTACVRFPFVPGEHAEVKVKNGTFELSGSTFYKQWADADELEENARKYYKQWETDSIILNYLKNHADEEGCVMRYWQYQILPRQTILSIIPASVRNGRFKHFFANYEPDNHVEYVPATVEPEPAVMGDVIGFNPTPAQKMELIRKSQDIKLNVDRIKNLYEFIGKGVEEIGYSFVTGIDLKEIIQRNKELDKQWLSLLKTLNSIDIPSDQAPQIYNELYNGILKFYSEQSKAISEIYMKYGGYTKEAEKAQKIVIKLTEKRMKERSKKLAQMKP